MQKKKLSLSWLEGFLLDACDISDEQEKSGTN
jgi:hypothetical protein